MIHSLNASEDSLDKTPSPPLESHTQEEELSSWHGRVDLNLSNLSGNTDSSRIDIEAEVRKTFSTLEERYDSLHFTSRYKYRQTSHKTDARKGHLDGIYKGKILQSWSWFAEEKLSFDDSIHLSARAEESIGILYFPVKNPSCSFNFKFGVSRVDDFYDPGGHVGEFRIPLGWDFEWIITSKLTLTHELKWQPQSSSFSNYLLYISTKLEVPLNDHWAANIKHEVNTNSKPSSGKEKTDMETSMRLGYTF